MSKKREPNFAVETISPELARRFLAGNSENRRIRENTVAQYAADMRAGNWKLTGAPILLNGDGKLYDGQHRLLACIAAGKPFTTIVGRGIDGEVQGVIDSGLKRTLADILTWKGYHHAAGLSALVYFAWRFERGLLNIPRYPSHQEALAWLEEHGPDAVECVRYGATLRKSVSAPLTGLTAPYFLTAQVDAEAGEEFMRSLASGVGLTEGSPVLVARRWIDSWSGKRDRPATIVYAAAVLKAMNAYRSGHSPSVLTWRRNEDFPRVWGTS